MCGIVGLYAKNKKLRPRIGEYVSDMLIEMSDRGPDSAGLAVYPPSDAKSRKRWKLTVFSEDARENWSALAKSLGEHLGGDVIISKRASHCVLSGSNVRKGSGNVMDKAGAWIEAQRPDLTVMSAGDTIEIYKEKGLPRDVVKKFNFRDVGASHAIGHTRMATESAVTTEHSHPFSTGQDLCLVHNGSLSNHNRLRDYLKTQGISFKTDNDSEVAAGYLAWRLGQGHSLQKSLMHAVDDLDGFYTFAIGTRDGFAVLRDPIACKPAVLAETRDWVAMSSEFRAIAKLPGAKDAKIWEPEPGKVYSWGAN